MSGNSDSNPWQKAKENAAAGFSPDKEANEPCFQCNNRHWLHISVKPMPDVQPRPTYWPEFEKITYNGPATYQNEPAMVTGIPEPLRKLDRYGQIYVTSLPAGSHDLALIDLVAHAKKQAKRQAES